MKWLKIAAIAIAPLILIWGVWSFMKNNQSPLPSERAFVDVTTGEIINLSSSKIRVIPERNSKGEPVLFPVILDESGNYVIIERYRSSLSQVPSGSLKVDPKTFHITR